MKHNIQKLPLCQLCEKSQAGFADSPNFAASAQQTVVSHLADAVEGSATLSEAM